LPIRILGAKYFTETGSKAVDCFDYVFNQLHLKSIIVPEAGMSDKMFLGTYHGTGSVEFKTRGQRSEIRRQMTEDRGQRADDRGQLAADSGERAAEASGQLPEASLGHYAALSFIVKGRRWNWGFGIEERRKVQGTRHTAGKTFFPCALSLKPCACLATDY